MAGYTPFLRLFQQDDPDAFFNVEDMLNANWGKVDAVFDADQNAAKTPQKPFVPMCKIGSYTGSGGHGASHPCSIENIGFVPDFVVVTDEPSSGNYEAVRLFRPFSSSAWVVAWATDAVSWYYTVSAQAADAIQCNVQGVTYHYMIIGHKEASA